MANRSKTRTEARSFALQVLYSIEITKAEPSSILNSKNVPAEAGLITTYGKKLVNGVCENKKLIDKKLTDTAENWSLLRMPVVDLCLLRLAVYEMLFESKIPIGVSIDEAVNLAKSFGAEDDSSRFINGVLGQIAKSIEAE